MSKSNNNNSNNKKKKNRSKKIGNSFENKIAKLLGKWWFDDEYALKRHDTSGAIKFAWSGDIVPQKLIPWKGFPFLIECKSVTKTLTRIYCFKRN